MSYPGSLLPLLPDVITFGSRERDQPHSSILSCSSHQHIMNMHNTRPSRSLFLFLLHSRQLSDCVAATMTHVFFFLFPVVPSFSRCRYINSLRFCVLSVSEFSSPELGPWHTPSFPFAGPTHSGVGRAVERPSSLRTEAERGRGPSEPKRKGSPPLAWVSIHPLPSPPFPTGRRGRRGGQPHPPLEGVPTRPCPQQGDIPRRRIGLSHKTMSKCFLHE